jgi:hypothetical protein
MSDRYPGFDAPALPRGRGAALRPLLDQRDGLGRIQRLVQGSEQITADAVQACLLGGLGVLLAPTSDGGAISVTVYDGQERYKSYAASPEEFAKLLEAVKDRGDASSVANTPTGRPRPAVKRT